MAEKTKKTAKKAVETKPKTTRKSAKLSTETKSDIKKAEKAAVKEATEKLEEKIEEETVAEAIVEAEKQLEDEAKQELAKAGKRSAKALKEEQLKAEKEQRKAHIKTEEALEAPKPKVIKVRPRIERKGKKFQTAAKLIEKSHDYNLKEAMELAIKSSPVKFDATVELHIKLNVDPRQSEQNIRASLVLPSGTGKTTRIAVFADADQLEAAKKAGAVIAAGDELLQQIDKGRIDFDILIATPAMMPKLGKYARILGPKGLMPNPKSGTVTNDIARAVAEAKAGRVEYRVDSTGIIHVAIGKVSFGKEKLEANAQAVFASVKTSKPSTIKGNYVQSIYTASSMGPGIRIAISEL